MLVSASQAEHHQSRILDADMAHDVDPMWATQVGKHVHTGERRQSGGAPP